MGSFRLTPVFGLDFCWESSADFSELTLILENATIENKHAGPGKQKSNVLTLNPQKNVVLFLSYCNHSNDLKSIRQLDTLQNRQNIFFGLNISDVYNYLLYPRGN